MAQIQLGVQVKNLDIHLEVIKKNYKSFYDVVKLHKSNLPAVYLNAGNHEFMPKVGSGEKPIYSDGAKISAVEYKSDNSIKEIFSHTYTF